MNLERFNEYVCLSAQFFKLNEAEKLTNRVKWVFVRPDQPAIAYNNLARLDLMDDRDADYLSA
jgi:hypothetical protein